MSRKHGNTDLCKRKETAHVGGLSATARSPNLFSLYKIGENDVQMSNAMNAFSLVEN